MDRIDTMLEEFFKPEAPPRLSERLLGSLKARPESLEKLADRFRIDASDEGVVRFSPDAATTAPPPALRVTPSAPAGVP
jgi:hypothetical protein